MSGGARARRPVTTGLPSLSSGQKLARGDADPSRRYATLTFLRGAFVALMIALIAGLLGAFYSAPAVARYMQPAGLDLTSLRPLHTTFATAFIFLGAMAVVHRFLEDEAGAITKGDRWRLRVHVICWAVAGAGILITVPLGITSGREYLGFHPIFSIPILLGWCCFAWTFLRVTWRSFWRRPVYVTMWGVGCLFFVYTFVEQHAWMLPEVFADPVVDRRLQWKACGTLVGSFNLFVYGALIYTGERVSGNKAYAKSPLAYRLFAVGLLNSFTNFAHHTYHLPQSHIVKWIAFSISMLEIIILLRVVADVARILLEQREGAFCSSRAFVRSSKWWTVFMLATSLLLSIPPLNSLVHGTYVVAAHAMGTMIGIDTFVLLGALTWILAEILVTRGQEKAAEGLHCRRHRAMVIVLNVSLIALIGWLNLVGLVDGIHRYLTPRDVAYALHRPQWLTDSSGLVFAVAGTATFVAFAGLLASYLPIAFRVRARDASPQPDR